MTKCIKCDTLLKDTHKSFTGVCNFGKGQYITFYYCPNEECDRYKLYCDHTTSENRE